MTTLPLISSLPTLPSRPRTAHKGTFGTVVVAGGSEHMFGAPCMTALAALRSGCGLVRLAVPSAVLAHAIAIEPSVIGVPLPRIARRLLSRDDAHVVVAAGPGLETDGTRDGLIRFLWTCPNALVLDAGGLTILAKAGTQLEPRSATAVVTPHPLECLRLTQALGIPGDPRDAASRVGIARALATRIHAVVVLKGHQTVVSDGTRTAINRTGNAALAIPGSGDVLTGLIASLMAQGMDAFPAAQAGACIHGMAGDIWYKTHGAIGLLARELAGLLPQAISAYQAGVGSPSRRAASCKPLRR